MPWASGSGNRRTGAVSQVPGLEEALREADAAFRAGDVADICYGYRDLCDTSIMDGSPEKQADRVGDLLAYNAD